VEVPSLEFREGVVTDSEKKIEDLQRQIDGLKKTVALLEKAIDNVRDEIHPVIEWYQFKREWARSDSEHYADIRRRRGW
jgi:cell division protein FtsB